MSSAASLSSADTVSQSPLRAADCFERSRITALQPGNAVDWQTVSATVDAQGRTSLPGLATKEGEANYIATMYTRDPLIRSGVGHGKKRFQTWQVPPFRLPVTGLGDIARRLPVKSAT